MSKRHWKDAPNYLCTKQVRALKIKSVELRKDRLPYHGVLTPERDNYMEIWVSDQFIERHNPQPGDYFVLYKDGYTSISPPEPFEKGYRIIGTGMEG